MYLNEADIKYAASRHHECPNVQKGLKLLVALVNSVNQQSDGWPYAVAPRKSAEKLQELLKTAGNLAYGTHGTITAVQLKAAITPIRRMVTIQKEKQKKFGNTFDFDVDAALA
jgi:hypothetical protein